MLASICIRTTEKRRVDKKALWEPYENEKAELQRRIDQILVSLTQIWAIQQKVQMEGDREMAQQQHTQRPNEQLKHSFNKTTRRIGKVNLNEGKVVRMKSQMAPRVNPSWSVINGGW